MITRIIDAALSHRLIVLLLSIMLGVWGSVALMRSALDAIPDLSDTQVIIRSDFAGQSPQSIENLLTYPLSSAMLGLSGVKDVRGYSMNGSSFVYVIFKEEIDPYWARSRVLEALSRIESQLPKEAQTRIGSDATGAGWVYQYALIDPSGTHDLSELRSLQDWFLRYELSALEGVSEVASIGGYVREWRIEADAERLAAYGLSLSDLERALEGVSRETGAGILEVGESELMIRSEDYVQSEEALRSVVLSRQNGSVLTLGDVALITQAGAPRRGVSDLNGEGEVVSGIVIMRPGENALRVIERVKKRLEELQSGLPQGVQIRSVYDRAPLIEEAVAYLGEKLLQEALAVALITFAFLLHVRSALVALITLPLGILGAFILMHAQGISANIMSLGGIAIAIGAMVDASIVMVENVHRKLADAPYDAQNRTAIVAGAMKEVASGIFFSLLIITVSFLPVFALSGESYRLFAPLAFTKTYAMATAALLSITLIPVLALYLVRGRIRSETHNPLSRLLIALYRPALLYALRFKKSTVALALVALLSTLYPLSRLGSEFMPALYEGELLYMPTTLPGVSITEAASILAQTHRLIKTIPEVEQVFGKAGRADSATDPAPLSMIESWIRLKPKEQWRAGLEIDDLIAQLDERVQLPGLTNSWGYPIKTRMDMISTGIKTPVGIKISGDTLSQIAQSALHVEEALRGFEGVRSVFADRLEGGKYLEITPDREAMRQKGVQMRTLQPLIATALGGKKVGESLIGRERYAITLRLQRGDRDAIDAIARLSVPTVDGSLVTLEEVTSISVKTAAAMIRSENGRLSGWVYVDLHPHQDVGSFIARAKQHLAGHVTLPRGYALEWSGQFEQMREAQQRLSIVVPMTLALIVLLLLMHFGRIDRTMMVLLSLPFALIGGFWALFWAGYHLSVAVWIGFIALGGLAVETAVVMLLYLDLERVGVTCKASLHEAIVRGALLRLRPKLMTVSTILIGLLPIFLSEGVGSDVMRRIALPMLGGVLSSTLLILLVLPALYALWEGRSLPNAAQ